MAKRKSRIEDEYTMEEGTEVGSPSSKSKGGFDEAFDKFLKNNHADSIIDNLRPTEFLDTKIPGLNFILSGKPKTGGVALNGKSMVWYGTEGSGKQAPLWSKVLTPKGFVKMGDLQIGDEVCTPNGEIAHITHIFPQGIKPVYKVTMSDGSTTYCGIEHLWKVKYHNKENWKTRTLREVVDYGLKRNLIPSEIKKNADPNKCLKWEIPMVKETKMYCVDYDIHPYILGVLIGDGYLGGNNTIRFTIPDNDIDISKKVLSLLSNGYKLSEYRNENYCPYYNIIREDNNVNGYIHKIRNLNLDVKSRDKFIPNIYMNGSWEQRKDLLAGLMDTDGSTYVRNAHGTDNATTSYSTTSKKLAYDVQQLVWSLGGISKVHEQDRGEKGLEYHVTIKTPFNPFSCMRKASKWIQTKRGNKRYIANVELYSEEECQCIKLDTKEGLYITDDYIVTHNSSFVAHMIKIALEKNMLVLFLNSEGGLTPERLSEFGIDLKSPNFKHLDPRDLEQAFEIIEHAIDMLIAHNENNRKVLIVYDSIAGNTTQESLERNMRDMEVATDAKVLKRGFHRIRKKVRQVNAGLIFVQQSRLKIGAIGHADKYDLPGGQVLKHFVDILVRCARGKPEDYGQEIKITTPLKNRLTTPRQSLTLFFDFEKLFTKEESIRSLVNLMDETEFLGSSGAWCYFKEEPDKKFYKKDLVKELMENESRYNELLAQLEDFILKSKQKIRITGGDEIVDYEGLGTLPPLEENNGEEE